MRDKFERAKAFVRKHKTGLAATAGYAAGATVGIYAMKHQVERHYMPRSIGFELDGTAEQLKQLIDLSQGKFVLTDDAAKVFVKVTTADNLTK